MLRLTLAILGAVLAVGVQLTAARDEGCGGGGRLTGGSADHTVARGETLAAIGSSAGVDVATIAADNALNVSAPLAIGRQLRIDNHHIVPAAAIAGGIVINIPQRMLFFAHDGRIDAMPIAVGRPGWETPPGAFVVMDRRLDPTWHVPASILRESALGGRSQPPVVPPGPNNPLGGFWIGLSLPGIGIHGTTTPGSIYHAATHGCIRVGAADIRRLFPLAGAGTRGQILYEPILLADVEGEIYLELHPDVYRRTTRDPMEIVQELAAQAGLTDRIDWGKAAAVSAARAGIARVITNAAGADGGTRK